MTGKPPESGRSPVVHLALAEKFIAPFIAFTREHFPADRHRFVVRGENRNYPVVEGPGVRVIRSGTWHPRTLWAIYSECRDAERIILHGLYCRVILAILLLFRRFRRKAFWFSWGSDINDPAHRHRVSLSRRLRYLMRRRVAPDLAALVCYVAGDAEAALKLYRLRGAIIRCHKYPSNIVQSQVRPPRDPAAPVMVQVGHSAATNARHPRAFAVIRRHPRKDVRVFCPLAYGDGAYGRRVVALGQALFGDAFEAQTRFIPREEYLARLKSIDIAVFAGRSQQAMGNILALLAMGAKVHLDASGRTFAHFRRMGITVYSLDEYDGSPDFPDREHNMELVPRIHSKARLLAGLQAIYDRSLRPTRRPPSPDAHRGHR